MDFIYLFKVLLLFEDSFHVSISWNIVSELFRRSEGFIWFVTNIASMCMEEASSLSASKRLHPQRDWPQGMFPHLRLYDRSVTKKCLSWVESRAFVFSQSDHRVSSSWGSHGFIFMALVFQPGAVRDYQGMVGGNSLLLSGRTIWNS